MSKTVPTFDADERRTLAALADVLIPAGDGFLSASQADVAGVYLDDILAVRPDLVGGLKRILQAARGNHPQKFMTTLQREDASAFNVLAEIVPGAYFMNPTVRAALGYEGQTPRAIDPHPDYLDDGLLQSVIDRGPIYRRTTG